ncbi:uncharacterized protein [Henckelia pumila]|uniref:uncharacterized protein isoform X7 n=1 Tax=Henckelia pumila TaxID=405737 RepID=UPI003C6E968B
MYHPSRGGVRGGRDQFSWDDVKVDKHRENYLGHNLKAPVERWQKVSCSFPPMCLPSMLTPPMATLGIRDATKKSLVQSIFFSYITVGTHWNYCPYLAISSSRQCKSTKLSGYSCNCRAKWNSCPWIH